MGNDTLYGGTGRDVLTGNSGANVFMFSTAPAYNADWLTDFATGADELWFSSIYFNGPGGVLSADRLALGTAAADADDRFIYDQATGRLWYDADGSLNGRSQALVHELARWSGDEGAALTAEDIFIY